MPRFPRSLRNPQQHSHRALGCWGPPQPGHCAPERPGPCHLARTGHRFPGTRPAAATATWLLGLSLPARHFFPFGSDLPKQPLRLHRTRARSPRAPAPRPSLPAQLGEGLEIELLDFLFAQPVANSLPFQKGLHLPPRAGSLGPEEIAHRPSLAASARRERVGTSSRRRGRGTGIGAGARSPAARGGAGRGGRPGGGSGAQRGRPLAGPSCHRPRPRRPRARPPAHRLASAAPPGLPAGAGLSLSRCWGQGPQEGKPGLRRHRPRPPAAPARATRPPAAAEARPPSPSSLFLPPRSPPSDVPSWAVFPGRARTPAGRTRPPGPARGPHPPPPPPLPPRPSPRALSSEKGGGERPRTRRPCPPPPRAGPAAPLEPAAARKPRGGRQGAAPPAAS